MFTTLYAGIRRSQTHTYARSLTKIRLDKTLPKGWSWKNRVTTAHRPAGVCEAADAVDLHLYRSDYPDGIHGHCTMLPVNDRRVSFLGALAEKGLGGSVYTQTTDVEVEINGLMTYDRKVLKFDPEVLRRVHRSIQDRARAAAR